jgi:hypothetical protein
MSRPRPTGLGSRDQDQGCAPTPPVAVLLSAAYRATPEPFWALAQARGEDGYGRMERAVAHGWRAVPGWGQDGWDLGSWPLVVIFHRESPAGFEVAENVEGDITAYRYPTAAMRERATDGLAFFHWELAQADWVAGITSAEDMPGHLRGPYPYWNRPAE